MEAQSHDCKEVISKVNAVLDGELSTDEEKRFLDQVNCCPSCLKKYKIEQSFKKFLVQKIEKKCISTNLIETIKMKIRGKK